MLKLLGKGPILDQFGRTRLPSFTFVGTRHGIPTPCYWVNYWGANRWSGAGSPFLRGVSRLIDPCSLIRCAGQPEAVELEATTDFSGTWTSLAGDWERIGDDIWSSVNIASEEIGTSAEGAYQIGYELSDSDDDGE